MAYIRVAYLRRDRDFDYVPGHRLTTLIAQDEISHFFRPAEKRWVSVKFDAVRGEGRDAYQGPERRRNDRPLRAAGKEAENYPSGEEASGKDWLEGLWRQIETS
jgi:hypothetical protein